MHASSDDDMKQFENIILEGWRDKQLGLWQTSLTTTATNLSTDTRLSHQLAPLLTINYVQTPIHCKNHAISPCNSRIFNQNNMDKSNKIMSLHWIATTHHKNVNKLQSLMKQQKGI